VNCKFCTEHIFSRQMLKGGKAKNQTPLKKPMQLHHLATSFLFLSIFFVMKENGKNMFNDDFCSIKNALFNGVLEFKFALCFGIKILLFTKETKKMGSFHQLAVFTTVKIFHTLFCLLGLLRANIFQTNNAKKIEFVPDCWRW
jgi:hypothetical protein